MAADVRSEGRLPRPLTSFIGREDVLAAAARLLREHRLLTLTGPGGSGKTRVAIELATRLGERFPDGVHFVPLAAVRDPTLIPSSIAQALGLPDSRDTPLVEHLGDHLRGRSVLVVVDNVEQVLAGAALVVARLLAASDTLHLVVTSRSPLHVSGEQELPVPPLPLPTRGSEFSPESLAQWESTSLFLARARATAPAFSPGADEAAAVAGIVRRLEGLPLAIELAATRVKVLPVASILARLDDSLGLLVGGHRDAPLRQQTMRATITWSHDLLTENGRHLLAVLGVFRGSAALSDVEKVCEAVAPAVAVLDAVGELVDHSLVRLQPDAGEPRHTMLEAVREFAVERLDGSPDAGLVRRAHAAVFASLAGQVERPPVWPDGTLLDRLDRDHDNLRAALDWLQADDATTALAMAAHLTGFWSMRGHFSEGRRRLRTLLDLVPAASPERVAALTGAGWLAMDQGDVESSLTALDEAVGLARSLGDRVGEGGALLTRGRTGLGGRGIEAGGRDLEAALRVLSGAGDDKGAAAALFFSGLAPQFSGDLPTACARFEAAVERCADLGLPTLRARALQLLGIARILAGDVRGAWSALAEGVPVVVRSGDRFGIAVGLGALVGLAAVTDRPRLALRLAGALDEYAHVNQLMPPQPLRELTEGLLAPARAAVGAAADVLTADGHRISVDDAVATALSHDPEQPWRAGPGPALSRRESEVAQLVASGLTNRDIAARLVLSVRTVDVHVDRILTKLGFHSRTQLTAWAHQRGIMPTNPDATAPRNTQPDR
ncbi:LuxR C-terminal-related transcriptional regulator [Terrabacter sp. MAHUQ-38]|uniref:ATP-binding protein n=1 Tax=unclassified Terrabacter TaxID=2630222 RepID=UPI00165DE2BB|nr:LuxR family transcriptional regulator [Terrabacter sp. MAHUQ-38]